MEVVISLMFDGGYDHGVLVKLPSTIGHLRSLVQTILLVNSDI